MLAHPPRAQPPAPPGTSMPARPALGKAPVQHVPGIPAQPSMPARPLMPMAGNHQRPAMPMAPGAHVPMAASSVPARPGPSAIPKPNPLDVSCLLLLVSPFFLPTCLKGNGKHKHVLKYFRLNHILASEAVHPPAPAVAPLPHAFGHPCGLQSIRPASSTGSLQGAPVKTQATPLQPEFCRYLCFFHVDVDSIHSCCICK